VKNIILSAGMTGLLEEAPIARALVTEPALQLVTHDTPVLSTCDRTIDLVDGRIVSDQVHEGSAGQG